MTVLPLTASSRVSGTSKPAKPASLNVASSSTGTSPCRNYKLPVKPNCSDVRNAVAKVSMSLAHTPCRAKKSCDWETLPAMVLTISVASCAPNPNKAANNVNVMFFSALSPVHAQAQRAARRPARRQHRVFALVAATIRPGSSKPAHGAGSDQSPGGIR